jgi:hypothetical protein
MTRLARASIDGGVTSPSARAVFALMTSSNVVGCSIGKSAGFTRVEQTDDNLPGAGLRLRPRRQKKREGESNRPRKDLPPFHFSLSIAK